MSDKPELEFTGERFTPECVREIAYEHWHRYAWAAEMVAGKRVLDAACGEGYGSHLLSARAEQVTGLDVSEQTVEHARQRYRADNLKFECGDATQLPYEDNSFDVVVSFETLEHLEAQDRLLTEFRRVLVPDGFLLVSSPDRKTYSDETGYDNPFHVRELYRDELEDLIGRHFPVFRLWGQRLMFVSALWQLDEGAGIQCLVDDAGKVEASNRPTFAPVYFIAAAAAEPEHLPPFPAHSLYSDRAESVYSHYHDVVRKHIQAENQLSRRDAEIRQLREMLARPWWRRLFERS